MPHTRRRMLLFVLLLTAACNALNAAPSTQTPPKIVYGLAQSISSLDLHFHQSVEAAIILRQIYDTLLYRNPETREFVPGLAQSWSISDDRLEYTFILREDVTFHDGTPFNAQAVAANLQRILSSGNGAQYARHLLGPISSYQVLGDYAIKISLNRPFEPLLDSLSQVYLGVASPTALAEFAEEPVRYQFHQVGTGPFEFVEYVPEDRVVLRRNPNYTWGPNFYRPPEANAVQEIEFRFFRDPNERLQALEDGRVQIMDDLLPLDARNLTNNPDISLLPSAIAGEPLQFYFNTQLPPTNNLQVRQALIYGSNRTSIVETVYGGFSPLAWGPIAASSLYYNRGVRNVYAYNLQQAQALLAQSGYSDSNDDGILERDGEPLSITVVQTPGGLLPDVTQLLLDQWQSFGVHVIVKPVPGEAALLEAVQEGEYNLIAAHRFGLDPYILGQDFLSNSPDNWTGFGSPELDSVLLEAEQTSDPEQRRLLYGRAQAIIMEQALILPIRDYVNLNGYTNTVQGLRYDAYGWFPLLYETSLIRSNP